MQTQTQAAAASAQVPATPQAPAPPQVQLPAPVITIPGPGGTTQTLTIPATSDEVEALLSQRSELASQLGNVTSRRDNLSEMIRSAPEGASRAGLEDRIRLLDQRILQLEGDLAIVGRKISSAPAELVATTENRNSDGDEFGEGLMIGGFVTLLLFPLALLYARRRWKRKLGMPARQTATESSQRFDRLEQGIEAIAIEVERVSEGQRFVTRLLSESQTPLGVSHRIPQGVAATREEPPVG